MCPQLSRSVTKYQSHTKQYSRPVTSQRVQNGTVVCYVYIREARVLFILISGPWRATSHSKQHRIFRTCWNLPRMTRRKPLTEFLKKGVNKKKCRLLPLGLQGKRGGRQALYYRSRGAGRDPSVNGEALLRDCCGGQQGSSSLWNFCTVMAPM